MKTQGMAVEARFGVTNDEKAVGRSVNDEEQAHRYALHVSGASACAHHGGDLRVGEPPRQREVRHCAAELLADRPDLMS